MSLKLFNKTVEVKQSELEIEPKLRKIPLLEHLKAFQQKIKSYIEDLNTKQINEES